MDNGGFHFPVVSISGRSLYGVLVQRKIAKGRVAREDFSARDCTQPDSYRRWIVRERLAHLRPRSAYLALVWRHATHRTLLPRRGDSGVVVELAWADARISRLS